MSIIIRQAIPGIFLTGMIASIGIISSSCDIARTVGLSGLTLAILFGMVAGNMISPRIISSCQVGIDISKQKLLRIGIVFYGLRITFQQIESVGMTAILTDFIVLSSTFCLAYLLGTRCFKLERETALLIGAGSSICGAAAVMATVPVVKPKSSQVSIAVATVVVFGTIAMFLYPALYHLGSAVFSVFSSPNRYGVYAGSTIHEVAQVYAAGQAIGAGAADTAVIVKMIRVMMLAPFLVILSIWLSRRDTVAEGEKRRMTIPWFAVFFVVMAGVNSLHVLPEKLSHILTQLDNWVLAVAMAALGLTTHLKAIREAGLKPLILGAILFAYLIFGGALINWCVAHILV